MVALRRSLLLLTALLLTTECAAQRASFHGLGDLPGGAFESSAGKVTADGTVVVGTGATAAGRRAFRWTPETGLENLGEPPPHRFGESWAYHVSADGSVIVDAGDPAEGLGWDGYRGFVWTEATGMVESGSLEADGRSEVFAASADGSVIVGDGGSQAFRWTDRSGMTGLGLLPGRTASRAVEVSADGAVAVGSSYRLPGWDAEQAFRWTREEGMTSLGALPGAGSSFAPAVSPDGSVIVGTAQVAASYPAFRWTAATGMIDLGHLPGNTTTHPFDLTERGAVIVGGSYGPRGTSPETFIWDAKHGMRSLQAVLETEYSLDLSGWTLRDASGITPDGNVIVGTATNQDGVQEAYRVVLDTSLSQASGAYLGQSPPSDTAEVFAPGVVSTGDVHGRLVVSPDGDVLVWTVVDRAARFARIRMAVRRDGTWSPAETPSFAQTGMTANPLFSPEGSRLYFNHRDGRESPWNVRYVERTETGWSEPRTDGFLFNVSASFTTSGFVYYTDSMRGKAWNWGTYRARYAEDGFVDAEPLDSTLNSPFIDYTPFVAPDETYLLFASSRPSMNEDMYLYVSFRDDVGRWSPPQRIHEAVGFPGNARFPTISPDGRYLFFCGDDGNVYWARIDTVHRLRPKARRARNDASDPRGGY